MTGLEEFQETRFDKQQVSVSTMIAMFVSSYALAFWLGVLSCLCVVAIAWFSYQRNFKKRQSMCHASQMSELSRENINKIFSKDNGGLPPWLKSPDFNNPTFINAAMQLLWPKIDKAGAAWAFKDRNLENLLNNETFWKPKWLAASGVVLQSLVLGQTPPKVTDIKVYPSSQGSTGTAVVADVAFSWDSKMEVKLAMKTLDGVDSKSFVDKMLSFIYSTISIKVVVRNLVARGSLRVILSPLVDKIPVVGGAHVSFLEAPSINYEVSSFGANPLMLPGLESWMNSFISEQVMNPFTFPDGFALDINKLLGFDGIAAHLHPEGILAVTIKSASGVPRTDWFGLCDPYVKVFLKPSVKSSTTVKSNTLSPVWNEEFDFVVHDMKHQALHLHLYDSETLRQDSYIGNVSIPLNKIKWDNGIANIIVPVDIFGRKKKSGRKASPTLSVSSRGSEIDDIVSQGDFLADSIIYANTLNREEQKNIFGYGNLPDALKTIAQQKECKIHLKIEFIKFSVSEVNAVSDAVAGKVSDQDAYQELSNRARRFIHGGMLYITLSRALNLKSGTQITKKFRIVTTVGKRNESPQYSRVSERTGLGRSLNARDPVFDDSLDILLDGDCANDADSVVKVEVFVIHLGRKPKSRGFAVIDLADVIKSGRMQNKFDLKGKYSGGQIEMGLEWLPTMDSL